MLLEREEILDRLSVLLGAARRGSGRLVLLSGEAGIGKTSVATRFMAGLPRDTPGYWGACDAVSPRRPFAPLSDVAAQTRGELQRAMANGDRDLVFEEFLRLIRHGRGRSRVVVFDDLHWADDATLDLLRVVGARIATTPSLLIGTYRDHEVGARHPLRLALGDVPGDAVTTIAIPPLSVDAVRQLAQESDSDIPELFAVTAGNPFFVTEVIAARGASLPVTVRDAVLSRVARLSATGQQVISAAAVLGPRAESDLVLEMTGVQAAAFDESLSSGIVSIDDGTLVFRHELARKAVVDALPSSDRLVLNARALALLRSSEANFDVGRLAHHAYESNDMQAIIDLAPRAGRRAAALGAHREARAHFEAVLRFRDNLPGSSHAELLEARAHECEVLDDIDAALASQTEAIAIWRELSDLNAETQGLAALSFLTWLAGDGSAATDVARRAVELIRDVQPPSRSHALAYAVLAQRLFVAGTDDDAARDSALTALRIAEQVGDEQVAVHALTTLGATNIFLSDEGGWEQLDEAVARARRSNLGEELTRGLINQVETAMETWRFDAADRYAEEAAKWLADHDLDLLGALLNGRLAILALRRGRWDEAKRISLTLAKRSRTASQVRARATTVLALVAARRGDADPWPLLDEALDLVGSGEFQDLRPIRAARIEAAWIAGDGKRMVREALEALSIGGQPQNDWAPSELAFWCWKARQVTHAPASTARPFALHMEGRPADAAAAWHEFGFTYQEALALADADDPSSLRRSLQLLHGLGATAVAGLVSHRLLELGQTGLPRGPRSSTRKNPFGLTDREMEVLTMLGTGMRNAEMAELLVVSAKTVDHHVSAVLRKLDVPNRAAAAEVLRALGEAKWAPKMGNQPTKDR